MTVSEFFEEYTVVSGRISLQARLIRAGCDVCVILTGGDVPHIGAIGMASGGKSLFSQNLPGHREQALTDIFLEELTPVFNGNLLVSAGVHLDAIAPDEIQKVLEISCELARRIAGESQFLNEQRMEKTCD